MRKYYYFILLLSMVFSGLPGVALGEATYSAVTNVVLNSVSLTISAGSTVDEITVDGGTLSVVLSAGHNFVINSAERWDFNVSGETNTTVTKSLQSDSSSLQLKLGAGQASETITVTVASTELAGNSSSGGNTSGGGGGGGGGSRSSSRSTTSDTDDTDDTETTGETDGAAGSSISAWQQLLQQYLSEAGKVTAGKNEVLGDTGASEDTQAESAVEAKYIAPLVATTGIVSGDNKAKMVSFVNYGTDSTIRLGAGERAGVLYCFQDVHGRLPSTQDDWDDVLKIANGRWPKQTNSAKESEAEVKFRQVYLRDPNRSNPHDDAAVVVIAYGLKPPHRSLESEKAAIKTFRYVYGKTPVSNLDWKIVRAIAESGATR